MHVHRSTLRKAVPVVVAIVATGCCFTHFPMPGGSISGPVTTLAPGFAPDPTMLAGMAGGPLDAQTLDATCRGFVPAASSHALDLTQPITGLRVLVHSSLDTTLVVRLPDGRYLCNDDSDGVDPVVSGDFPAGRSEIWIGTYSQNTGAPYQLALTTNAALGPSTLAPAPAPTPTPTPTIANDGPPVRSGTAIVTEVSGNLPGVAVGTSCEWSQHSIPPSQNGFDCRWHVTCASIEVYGAGSGGYFNCNDPSLPAGTLINDVNPTGGDQDPSLVVAGSTLTASDDASGPRGPYRVVAAIALPPTPPG